MFSRIAAGALVVCALVGLPAGAHSPNLLPDAFDVSERDHVSVQASFTETAGALPESHHYALTFDVGE